MNETIRLEERAAAARPRPPVGRPPASVMMVRLFKIVLPLGALGMMLLVVSWPQINKKEVEGFRAGVSELTQEQARNSAMVAPRFEGFDEKNRPFALRAEQAKQSGGDASLVELTEPRGDMTLEDGGWIAVNAHEGVYDREAARLELSGRVQLFHDRGLELQTEVARIDLATNQAEGEQVVHGQGSFGTIDSEGFRVEDSGSRIVFTGRAHLVLYETTESPLL
jgi:lipopolysaccharide export system protein LptC